jgi:hypothetical protein
LNLQQPYTFVDFDGGAVKKSLILIRLELILVLQKKMVKGAGPVYAGSKIKMASAVDFSTKKVK